MVLNRLLTGFSTAVAAALIWHFFGNHSAVAFRSSFLPRQTYRNTAVSSTASQTSPLEHEMEDPSLVYQSQQVAQAFVDIRQGIPLAKEQMDTMIQIIRYFLRADRILDCSWLDLGCGDGPLGGKLVEAFPNSRGVFLDHSLPMLEIIEKRFGGGDELLPPGQVQVIQSDFSTRAWLRDLPKSSDQGFDVIVSGFSIHHVSHTRKRELYQEIFNLLKPGGVFLNMEHVSSISHYPTMENMFAASFCDSLRKSCQEGGIPKTDNEIACMVEQDLAVDREANILATVPDQCDWLQEIGFEHVDCYFKYFILALFGGVKPIGDLASSRDSLE